MMISLERLKTRTSNFACGLIVRDTKPINEKLVKREAWPRSRATTTRSCDLLIKQATKALRNGKIRESIAFHFRHGYWMWTWFVNLLDKKANVSICSFSVIARNTFSITFKSGDQTGQIVLEILLLVLNSREKLSTACQCTSWAHKHTRRHFVYRTQSQTSLGFSPILGVPAVIKHNFSLIRTYHGFTFRESLPVRREVTNHKPLWSLILWYFCMQ